MGRCRRCGQKLKSGEKTCSSCGTSSVTLGDIYNEKLYSCLAYCSVFVIILLFKKNKSSFLKYHVNQGLVLFLSELVINVIAFMVPITMFSMGITNGVLLNASVILIVVINMIVFIARVKCIFAVTDDKENVLPIIGKVKIIK